MISNAVLAEPEDYRVVRPSVFDRRIQQRAQTGWIYWRRKRRSRRLPVIRGTDIAPKFYSSPSYRQSVCARPGAAYRMQEAPHPDALRPTREAQFSLPHCSVLQILRSLLKVFQPRDEPFPD